MDLQSIILQLIMVAIFLGIAFPIHEFAHAWGAYLRGDATAKMFGRMPLSPVVHFDMRGGLMTILSIFVGGFLFGWAKPTPVNPANMKNRYNDEVIVALAGPASNLLMAVLGGIVVRVLVGVGVSVPPLVAAGLVNFVVFNVMLAVFNMIPVPPLDGSTLLFRFLPPRQVWQIRPFLSQYGMFIVLAVVLLGGSILSSVVYQVAFALMGLGL